MERFTILPEEQWYSLPKEKDLQYRILIGEKRKGRIMGTGFFVNDWNEIRIIDKFLNVPINGYYHADYLSAGSWAEPGTIETMIWTIKNDVDPFPDRLFNAVKQLLEILIKDLPQLVKLSEKNQLTVCVVPRSKSENYYRNDQKLFREAVSMVVSKIQNMENGTKYILRHTNTRTTHLDKNGQGGDGDLPYPGITIKTCSISENVKGKDILLIDDLYTKSVNIDEDAIQALLDTGAKSVFFYSIGKTMSRQQMNHNIIDASKDILDDDDLPF